MRTVWWVWLVFGMGGMSLPAVAQDQDQNQSQSNGAQAQPANPQPANPTPAPAFGQSAPILSPENPPVTGLDQPGLELRTATRSFISPAIQLSESAQTNGVNQLGNNDLESVGRVLGAVDLQQFWPKSDLFLEYLGGGAFYSSPYNVTQLEAAGGEAVTRWRTGQATVRDTFSYLPDGSFQIGYGGTPGLGFANSGEGGLLGGIPGEEQFGNGARDAIGDNPRLANTAIADVVQAITPRSAITVAGGFANAHFFDSNCSIPGDLCLLNSDQVTAQGGYSHLINRHDQIGVIYAFQLFQFPEITGGQIYVNIVNVRYSHTITGRLSLILSGGPQYIELEQGGYYKQWSPSAKAQLRYKWGHASVVGTYEKFVSSGSGFFAGANTQLGRLGYKRPLGRTWDFYADLTYSHNKKIEVVDVGATGANTYNEGSAGVVFRKHFGRTYEFFSSYRFSDLDFNAAPGIVGIAGNGKISRQQIGTIGVEWHPAPTRIK